MINNNAQNIRREADAALVTATLQDAGIEVNSVFDLLKRPDSRAIPILIDLLDKDLENWIKEGVVRALTIKQAKKLAAKPLLKQFRNPSYSDSLRWAIGNALEVMADDSIFQDIVELVSDKKHGTARQMLVLALGRMKNPKALDVLLRLLKDGDVNGHAIAALGKLKTPEARPHIENFLDDENAWIRKEAKRAIKKIDKATKK